MSLILCILGIGGYFLWHYLEQPALGTVRSGKLPVATGSFDRKNEVKRYFGKYIEFSYGAGYEVKRHETPVKDPVYERIFLSAGDYEGKKIAVTIEERPLGDFESSPSVKMRLDKPTEYKKSSFAESGFEGYFFLKESSVFETDAFFFAEGKLVSVAITSPLGADGLQEELLAFLKEIKITK
ncbi:MAG: hypothetical protein KBB77_00370 [Candidatus Moranbacteria bacterium]|nr:hypothetical protein [Candidatus Moranbacteria bacterium]